MTLPSVTQILQALGLTTDYSAIDPATLARARERGILVHAAIRDHHMGLGEAVKDWLPEECRPYYEAYQKFVVDTGHEPHASEHEVVSQRWKYVGHVDRIGWLGSQRTILDWKLVAQLDEFAVGLQMAAYRLAYNEQNPTEPVSQIVGVQFRSDGSYRLYPVDPGPMESVFKAALVVWWARQNARNGGSL